MGLRRHCPQLEIGHAIAFLCSDLASYVTGITVAVDGGMLLYPDFREGG